MPLETPSFPQFPQNTQTDEAKSFLEQWDALLQANFANPDFQIESACQQLLLSRSTLNRKVYEALQLTPQEALAQYRVQMACNLLLRHPTRAVSRVAEDAGFRTQSYLTRAFQRILRTTPTAYRKAHMKHE